MKTIILTLILTQQLIAGPTVYFSNGDVINYGNPEPPRNSHHGVITIVPHSRAEEPRYQAMLDEKDMKALIFINAHSQAQVIKIEN